MCACRTPAVTAAAGGSGQATLSAGGGSVCPGVSQRGVGTGAALGPEVFEAVAEAAAAQGEDGIGSRHAQMHAGALQACAGGRHAPLPASRTFPRWSRLPASIPQSPGPAESAPALEDFDVPTCRDAMSRTGAGTGPRLVGPKNSCHAGYCRQSSYRPTGPAAATTDTAGFSSNGPYAANGPRPTRNRALHGRRTAPRWRTVPAAARLLGLVGLETHGQSVPRNAGGVPSDNRARPPSANATASSSAHCPGRCMKESWSFPTGSALRRTVHQTMRGPWPAKGRPFIPRGGSPCGSRPRAR